MVINIIFKSTLLVLLSIATFNLQAKDNVVITWNKTALNAVQQTKMAPPMVSRALAMMHTGMFDAWTAYTEKCMSTQSGASLRRPSEERTMVNKKEAISFAAYRILLDLFPTQSSDLASVMQSLGYDPNDTSNDSSTPSGMGNLVASQLLNFRHSDGSNQLGNEPGTPLQKAGVAYADYTNYHPVNTPTVLNDPNRWQPLIVNGVEQVFLTPFWGYVTPCAITSGSLVIPTSSFLFPDESYTIQAEQLLELSAQLNNDTKSIAEYWADGAGTVTPPGHWNLIAQYVSNRDKHHVDADVKMFFMLNNAMFDAGIGVWSTKRFYDSIRPVSAIHFLFNNVKVKAWGGPGQGTKTILGQNFLSYIPTPPFAEYISGHSTFSAAAAEVLTQFTGSEAYGGSVIIKKGSSIIEPGITPTKNVELSWKTFFDASDQAGLSRRYGGIHFEHADLNGRAVGREAGKINFKTAMSFIEGVKQ